MFFLMKLLFGFCLDFLLPKNLDNTGRGIWKLPKKIWPSGQSIFMGSKQPHPFLEIINNLLTLASQLTHIKKEKKMDSSRGQELAILTFVSEAFCGTEPRSA